jgi:hypothetical protein|nr:MAG TPA: hypothetical protein [Caudoviricetes sp.]
MVPRRPPCPCCWTDPPGWHGSITGARPYIPYYNRWSALSCTASGVALVSGMRWRSSGRCDTLQRGAGGIIAACVGLVSWAAERAQAPEKLQ